MIIFIDTNVLFSAALKPGGIPHQAFIKAVSAPNRGIICEQNKYELVRVFNQKLPANRASLDFFLAFAIPALEIVPVPTEEISCEAKIRDASDRMILRAAVHANADVLLTGDKDFLESGLEKPIIITPAQFISETF